MIWFYVIALIACVAFMLISTVFISCAVYHNKKVLLDISTHKESECKVYHGFIHWLSQQNALAVSTIAFAISGAAAA